MDVKISGEGLEKIKSSLKFLKNNRVLVGIPQASSSQSGKPNNAELAYIHSNGSPKMHIPARPFLEPAIEGAKDQIAGCLEEAAKAAVEGDTSTASAALEKAGLYGENAAKDYFTGGHFAPNAPITIEGGWMRHPITKQAVYVKGKHSAQPLIDTGSLRSSITHVIEGK